jgi:NitT/TauT family transport system ATP-binding protein
LRDALAMRQIESRGSARASLISANALSKTYASERSGSITALQAVTFDIAEGEFVSLVGPSGCGKSTLLRLLAGLLPSTSGSLTLAGEPLRGPGRQSAIVFQSPVLLPWRTILQNILLPIEFRKWPIAEYRRKAVDLLALVGLGQFVDAFPYELSGGMQQRAAIVRALVQDPKLLLMDEPFGALDAMTREKMNVELMRIQRETGKTVLLITHSIPEAVFLADRVLVMTERPGAIAAIYDVPLPRPRSLDAMADPAFTELVQCIRKHFFTQSALD